MVMQNNGCPAIMNLKLLPCQPKIKRGQRTIREELPGGTASAKCPYIDGLNRLPCECLFGREKPLSEEALG
ncbi:hypothetical protein COV61_00395 [Candidatus Micrarchaeota archaeon CG11_big_fil_rev_8_21_14_0_20_47_5]|nr:MAG: hypothetical protein AUJ17_01835 [Candidatus Micrarchaeota archaeon CG1_02_47_40]PIN84343.1 MAG: hypothetical protein COV61_00395 [Candidatus Micrarchaeota archaeon CG11_big_fil_rev_8_21_14_0_20_47_5]